MNGRYILNANGDPEPCEDLLTWAKAFEGNRKVASDHVGNIHVSTVFLGLDHSFGGPIPILYETMVFGGPLDGERERYATREQAITGHESMLAKVRRRQ